MGACLARELAARRWRRDGRKARASEVLKSQTSWKLRGGEKAPRNEEEDVDAAQNSWKIAAADDGDGDAWRNAEASDTFARNVDPTRVHVARTGDGAPWVTSQHCFQCALNTIHTCDDFGSDIRTFAGIERKWISAEVSERAPLPSSLPPMPPRAQVSERVHYPRVRYVVAYPPRTPRLPYHDHPGGEEYLVLSGAFCDTNFDDVRAPAFVRYPIGTHHAAMSAPVDERSVILCWWGLMQATSATESGRHVPLDEETMVPKRGRPTVVDGDRLAWPLCGDGVETRVERWRAGADLVVAWARPRKEVVVLRGAVELVGDDGAPAEALGRDDWCALPDAAAASRFRVAPGAAATVLVKELWPRDDWRRPRFRLSGGTWSSWNAGSRAAGTGLVRAASSAKRLLSPSHTTS